MRSRWGAGRRGARAAGVGGRAGEVVEGRIEREGRRFAEGAVVIFTECEAAALRCGDAARVALLGGEPLEGARHIWWNFVASSPERIERAKRDWVEGKFAQVPGDPEFIPLPDH